MALIVQKYGGTSVGDLEKISLVADRIIKSVKEGNSVVVVLSAMQGETDKLLAFAKQMAKSPSLRELDALLATGEQVSVSLLAISLTSKGYKAKSYSGIQAGIKTNSFHGKARILSINEELIANELKSGTIVIVTGFQGVDYLGNITTLGRGGSDTTAVAIAAALKADECQIYTDVDGVYTTDPKVVEGARLQRQITFEEMLELSSLGAKVLQIRAVEFAGRYKVPLRVLNTFSNDIGTLIALEDISMEHPLVSGIAFNRDEAKLTIFGVPDRPSVAASILGAISESNIEVDMIVQNAAKDGTTDFTFTVHRNDYLQALEILRVVCKKLNARDVSGDNKIAKISLVGVGMRSHAGIASKMFQTLGAEGINIKMISTSEIKISVVVDEKYLELTVRSLHSAFNLSEDTAREKLTK